MEQPVKNGLERRTESADRGMSKRAHAGPAVGYVKGQETRLRIILAAIDLFGEEGYERASTRKIAIAAGVNLPALQYYFAG